MVNEGHQPRRTDQQELDVLEKGWPLTLEHMSDELADPGQYEHHQGDQPQGPGQSLRIGQIKALFLETQSY